MLQVKKFAKMADEEMLITPEITMHEEPGEIRIHQNSGELLVEIDDEEPEPTSAYDIPAQISITRVNKPLSAPKQFLKVRNDLSGGKQHHQFARPLQSQPITSRPPGVSPFQHQQQSRPPPLIRAGSSLPPMPRLKLGGQRPQVYRMNAPGGLPLPQHHPGGMPHGVVRQQSPLSSMLNMMPANGMMGPPRGPFVQPHVMGMPPVRVNRHPMQPQMPPRGPPPGNNGFIRGGQSLLKNQRPLLRKPGNRMPMSHRMMVPQTPLPPRISMKGPQNGIKRSIQPPPKPTPSPKSIPSPVPSPSPSPSPQPEQQLPQVSQVWSIQTPPPLRGNDATPLRGNDATPLRGNDTTPLRGNDIASKVLQNGGAYSFPNLNITVTSAPRTKPLAPQKPLEPIEIHESVEEPVEFHDEAVEIHDDDEEEEIDDCEEELDDVEPDVSSNLSNGKNPPSVNQAVIDNGQAVTAVMNTKAAAGVQAASKTTIAAPSQQKSSAADSVQNLPVVQKEQSPRRRIGTLKFVRTADGKGYIRRQTDNLLQKAKATVAKGSKKKKKRFFRGANYRFDGKSVKSKRHKNQFSSKTPSEADLSVKQPFSLLKNPVVVKNNFKELEKKAYSGDVLSYLGIQRKDSDAEVSNLGVNGSLEAEEPAKVIKMAVTPKARKSFRPSSSPSNVEER